MSRIDDSGGEVCPKKVVDSSLCIKSYTFESLPPERNPKKNQILLVPCNPEKKHPKPRATKNAHDRTVTDPMFCPGPLISLLPVLICFFPEGRYLT